MHDAPAPDVRAARQLGIGAHGGGDPAAGQRQDVGQRRIGQREGGRAGDEGGHVRHPVVNHAGNLVDGLEQRGRVDGLDRAALVDRHVDDHRAGLHALDEAPRNEHRCAGAGNQHRADQEVRARRHLSDVVAIGGERHHAVPEQLIRVAEAVQVDVEERDIGPEPHRALRRAEPDHPRADDDHVAARHAGHSRQEDAAPAVSAREIKGAFLDGEAPRHLAHRRQQGEAAVGALHRLVGDSDDARAHELPGQLGRGSQMEIGEEHLSRAKMPVLGGNGLLDLEDQVGARPHTLHAVERGARRRILLVADAASEARPALDDHAVAGLTQLPGPRRRQRHALLARLDLPRHADDHLWTAFPRGAGFLRAAERPLSSRRGERSS